MASQNDLTNPPRSPADRRMEAALADRLARFQETFRLLLESHGESQRALALALGFAPSHVWKLLRSLDANPELETLVRIADHYAVSIGELLGEAPAAPLDPTSWEARWHAVGAAMDPVKRETMIEVLRWVATSPSEPTAAALNTLALLSGRAAA